MAKKKNLRSYVDPGFHPEEEREERYRQLLLAFNRIAALYLRNLPVADLNDLIDLFETGSVIIGGDSACFHIRAGVFSGCVEDCNPWLEEEMAAGKLVTVALQKRVRSLVK